LLAVRMGPVLIALALVMLSFILWKIFPRKGKDLRNKTCLITGGANGIGRQMAIYFAQEGCNIVLWDIVQENLDKVSKEIKDLGVKVYAYKCDVTDRNSVFKTADQVRKDAGQVHILVNNAGVVSGKKFWELKPESIEKVMNVNIMGVMWVTRAFLTDFMQSREGHLVTIASTAAFAGVPLLADYAASKWAAMGFHESLRWELKLEGYTNIHTTVVCPLFISTGMFSGVKGTALMPLLTPESVARKVVHAVKTNKEELIIPNIARITFLLRFLPVPWREYFGVVGGVAGFMNSFKGDRKV